MPRLWRPPVQQPAAHQPAAAPIAPVPLNPAVFDGPDDEPAAPVRSRGRGGAGRGKGGAKRHRKVLRDNIQGITKPAIRRLARRGGVKRISGLIYEETRGVLKVFLENAIRDAVTYTEHARRKTVSAMDVVYALKRQGHTLYGFPRDTGTSYHGKRSAEEQLEERVQKQARRLAEAEWNRLRRAARASGNDPNAMRMPPNSQFLDRARQMVQQQRPVPAGPAPFSIDYQGVRVRAIPAQAIFAYEEGGGGYRLVKNQDGPHANLYDAIIASEGQLCDVGTGVSVSQSLRPNREGNGLLYQAGCKVLVAEEGGTLKGIAIVTTYEPAEGLISPRAFGSPVDEYVIAQAGLSAMMLELICARGPATADGRNANYLSAKALIQCVKQFATAQRYGIVVAKAENVRSRDFLSRRGFNILFQRGGQASMQASVGSITV